MNPEEKKVSDSVRQLREHLGKTQQDFAVEVGFSYPTIQRFEGQVPPKGDALARLSVIASKAGRKDLADVFLQSLLESEIGKNIAAALSGAATIKKTGSGTVVTLPGKRSKEMEDFLCWVEGIMRKPEDRLTDPEKVIFHVLRVGWNQELKRRS